MKKLLLFPIICLASDTEIPERICRSPGLYNLHELESGQAQSKSIEEQRLELLEYIESLQYKHTATFKFARDFDGDQQRKQ